MSAGNPFVAVETMRAHQEGQRLGPSATGGGAAALATLPERVREAIGGRLERLSPRARELVALAAVIGREFEFALLQRAARLDERAAAEGVEELVRRRVLHGVGARLDFVHDRVREVADGQVLPARRPLLHAAVGEAIESVYAERLQPHHGALGAHYRQGEVWDKALRYLRQAGKEAVACSANREALAYFEQALAVLEHMPAGRGRLEQSYDLQMNRASVLYSLSELQHIVDHLDETEALARDLDDQTRIARVSITWLGCLAAMGDQPRAIELGERGLTIAEANGNLPLQVLATYLLGFANTALGDFPRALTRHRQCAALLEDQPVHHRFGQVALLAVLWRSWILSPLAEVGAFAEAVALGHEARRIAEAAAQPYSMTVADGNLGLLYCLKGEPAAAIPVLERSVTLCRDYEISVLSTLAIGALGQAYAMAGRVEEALPLLESAVARSTTLGIMWWQPRRLAELADGYLRAGRVRDAAATAERALTLAETLGERGNRAWALRALADVALHGDAPDLAHAARHLAEAQEQAEALGMRPLVARCLLDRGRLSRRAGDHASAREQLTLARDRLAELDMDLWRATAEAELAAIAG
jgi:tetratricopeptide (TPR) repeat protein